MGEWYSISAFADSDWDSKITLKEWFEFHEAELKLGSEAYWQLLDAGGNNLFASLFEMMDNDKDGKIAWGDYEPFLEAYGVKLENSRDFFIKLNPNPDGFLTRDEWLKLGEQFFKDEPDAPGNWIFGPF